MSFFLSLVLAASPACSTSTDGGTVVSCGDARVLVSIAPGAPAEALPRVVEGMTRLYAATDTKAVQAPVGKASHPATEVTLFASLKDKTALGHALVTALPEKDSKVLSRVLVCTWERGPRPEGCARGFELGATVSNPTPPPPALPGDTRAWTGATLQVPSGCKQVESGAIACKEASLMWGDRPPDGPLNSQRLLAELALKQLPPGTKASERACRVGGKASTCSVLSGAVQGRAFSVLIGIGEVGGRSTSFQCMVDGALGASVPAPCDQVVRW